MGAFAFIVLGCIVVMVSALPSGPNDEYTADEIIGMAVPGINAPELSGGYAAAIENANGFRVEIEDLETISGGRVKRQSNRGRRGGGGRGGRGRGDRYGHRRERDHGGHHNHHQHDHHRPHRGHGGRGRSGNSGFDN